MNFLLPILMFVTTLFPVALMCSAALAQEQLPALPAPVSNNAVAAVMGEAGLQLVSAFGLEQGKTWRDVSARSWLLDQASGQWKELRPVPGAQGRLAASAVTVGGQVYLFGGYTVAEDGAEQSTAEVYRLNTEQSQWEQFSTMPVPVDDAVVMPYLDRYIYLVSGWHDLGNVNLVQILDTKTGQWAQGTPWPGSPVFGHAGAMSGAQMVICDGVAVEYPPEQVARKFVATDQCWLGSVHGDNYRRIDWRPLPAHPGLARYRMASGSDASGNIWFAGGSVNPYNFDGVGYDGAPSEPEAALFRFDLQDQAWKCHGRLAQASMDHRGLLWNQGWFYIIGGMRAAQAVSDGVFRFRPPAEQDCAVN